MVELTCLSNWAGLRELIDRSHIIQTPGNPTSAAASERQLVLWPGEDNLLVMQSLEVALGKGRYVF